MAFDRIALRKEKELSFSKLLGCGKGATFTPRDADVRRWGLLVCMDESVLESFDRSPIVMRWRRNALYEFRVVLDPISSYGKWSKKQPFVCTDKIATEAKKIVAITRARVCLRHYVHFLKAVPPVVQSLHSSPGLISAFGIGEAPIGLQGTFSLWESESSLHNFAFKTEAHKKAISEANRFSWFSEELFARLAVRDIRGSL